MNLQLDALGRSLWSEFEEAAKRRRPHERLWLKDLRQERGIYEPEVMARLKKAKRSRLFIRLTRVKTRWMLAKLMEALFPADGSRSWDARPTKVPTLNQHAMAKALERFVKEWGRAPDPDQVEMLKDEAALIAAQAMAEVMEDQLSEQPQRAGYRGVARRALAQGLRHGWCVLKGPLVEERDRSAYVLAGRDEEAGQDVWELQTVGTDLLPYPEAPDIWRVYLDPDAVDPEDLRYVFHEHLWSKNTFQKYAERKDFNGRVMLAHLKEFKDGDANLSEWEQDVRALVGEGEDKEETPYVPREAENRFQVVERWGWVAGERLAEAGEDIVGLLDPGQRGRFLEMAEAEGLEGEEAGQFLLDCAKAMDFPCWFFLLRNGKVIKYAPHPLKGVAIPYYFWWYVKDESSMYGEGIPADVRDPQGALNAIIRAAIDHMGATAGPMVALNVNALADTNDTDIEPFKKWLFADAEDMDKAIKFFSMSSNVHEYMAFAQFIQSFLDEVTVPRYMHGDSRVSGAGRTMRGLSMLMGTFGVNVAELVKTWDDNAAAPFLRALYRWNMQFNPREDIKGDCEVVALGSAALVAKEVQAENYAKALDVARQPEYAPFVNKVKALRNYFRSVEADADLIYSDEEVARNRERDMALEMRAAMAAMVEELAGRGLPLEKIAALLAGQVGQRFGAQPGPALPAEAQPQLFAPQEAAAQGGVM